MNVSIRMGAGWAPISEAEAPRQSELTHIMAREILEAGSCKLTPFAESMQLHRPYLSAMLDHVRSFGQIDYEVCPIT